MDAQVIEQHINNRTYSFEIYEPRDCNPHMKSGIPSELHDHLEQFLAFHHDFLYLLDRQHRFVYASPPLLEIWNKKLPEIIGKSFKKLGYPPELVELHETQLSYVFSKKVVRGENQFIANNGINGFFEYIFVPLINERGEVEYAGGITRDISSRKKSEQEKEELFLTIVHDFKNPLSVIKGIVELLERNSKTPSYLNKMLASNVSRLEHFADNILDSLQVRMGKCLKLQKQYQDLTEILKEVYEYLEAALGKCFKLELQADKLMGNFDSDAIVRIVENLAHNAVKYGDRKKPITITARKSHDNYALLSVHNYGDVIPPHKIQKLFTLYFQDDDKKREDKKGWGIGLTVVGELAKRHEGEVQVTSNEESGTEFLVKLPLARH